MDELLTDVVEQLFLELRTVVNFTIGKLYSDYSYSYIKNGIWYGQVREILSTKEADIGIGVFWMTNDRLNVVNFTQSVVRQEVSLIEWLAYFKV